MVRSKAQEDVLTSWENVGTENEGDSNQEPLIEEGSDEESIIEDDVTKIPPTVERPNPDPLAGQVMVNMNSPEGEQIVVPATEVETYEGFGFTAGNVSANSSVSDSGTLTVGADDHWVEFGKRERKAAEERLKRGIL